MKIYKKNKIIALLLLIILLFTNYYIFAEDEVILIMYDRTGGKTLSSIASSIGSANLNQNYNAQSTKIFRYDDKGNTKTFILTYKDSDGANIFVPQEMQENIEDPGKYYNYVYESSTACTENCFNYTDDDDLLFGGFVYSDISTINGSQVRTLKYGLRLPGGDMRIQAAGTMKYTDALLYNGKLYRVDFNIVEIRKTGSSPVVLSTVIGAKSTNTYSDDARDYTLGTYPMLCADPAEKGEKDFKMEVAVEYSIHSAKDLQKDYDKDLVPVSGVFAVENLNKNETIVLHDFKADSNNTFIKSEDENLMYKLLDGNNDTQIFSKASTNSANAYFKMDNVSKVNLTETFEGFTTEGLLFRFKSDEIPTPSYSINTKITGGTITPTITNIAQGEKEITIAYKPKDASKQYLKSIVIDGTTVYPPSSELDAIVGIENSYTFKNIQKNHTIEVIYEDIPQVVVTFDTKGGVARDTTKIQAQNITLGEKATIPATTLTRKGYEFDGWTLNNKIYDFDTQVTTNITLVAKWTPLKYEIEYDLDGGKNNSENPTEYTVEDNVIFKTPTKDNYTFDAWYTASDKKTQIRQIPIGSTEKKKIYANWIPNSGIQYKVQHYKMKANGEYPTIPTLEEIKYGTVGENVTATPQDYLGYQEDTTYAETVASKEIPETGMLILKLYYKTNDYKITYELNGGKNDTENPVKYTVDTETITFKSATWDKEHIFKGWYIDEQCKNEIKELVKGSTGNKTLYAKWEIQHESEPIPTNNQTQTSTTASYKVEHYKKDAQGKYKLASTNSYTGTIGEVAIAKVENFKGYEENKTYSERIEKDLIRADGSLVLKLYYDPILYKIDCVLDGDTIGTQKQITYTVNDTIELQPQEKEGYEFKGWYTNKEFKGEPITSIVANNENITLYAKWEAKDVKYKVEYYLEDEEGDYEIKITKETTGKTDSIATLELLDFQGYKLNKNLRNTTAKVAADGSSVLKVYYDREKYTVTFNTQNQGNAPKQTIKYSEKVERPNAPEKEGYKFEYWYYIDKDGNKVQYDFDTPVTSNVKLIAEYTALGDNTTAPTEIPKTDGMNRFIIFGIIALVTLTGVFGIKYFKFNNF